jgi:hypothetical protein
MYVDLRTVVGTSRYTYVQFHKGMVKHTVMVNKYIASAQKINDIRKRVTRVS